MKRFGAYQNSSRIFNRKFILPLFFILLFLSGIFIYKDYGLSWDEPYCRARGELNYQYISNQNNSQTFDSSFVEKWNNYPYHHHGPFFDLLFYSVEKILSPESSRQVFFLRHLLTFLVFFTACFVFYLINRYRFNWKLSLLATAFLILSPRIFAHAFYNAKDIIFMSMVIFSFYTMIRFLKNTKFSNLLIHAIITALTIDTRITGLFIPVLTIIFSFLFIRKDTKTIMHVKNSALYLIFLCLFIYVFWPWLWDSPIQNFTNSVFDLSNYEWKDLMLYKGKWIYSTEIPWHYLPTWIGITTPILYLLLFLVGLFFIFQQIIKKYTSLLFNTTTQFNLLVLSFLLSPVFAVLILGSTLYDGWRHMFFIYPFIIMIAIIGLSQLVQGIHTLKQKCRMIYQAVLWIMVTGNIILIIITMISNHPHQYIYFNSIAEKNPEQNYELDYWGLSYRQAYEELLNKFPNDTLLVCPANNAGKANAHLLDPAEQKRLKITEFNKAEYFVTNFRWVDRAAVKKHLKPYQHEILEIKIDGMKVAAVYKLK